MRFRMNTHSRYLSRILLVLLFLGQGLCVGQPTEREESNELPLADESYERIYVPEKSLAEYWTQVKPGVLLDRSEFAELLTQAKATGLATESSPSGILVKQVEFSVQLDVDQVQIQANCQLVKHRPGWASLLLPLNQVSLSKANLNGETAPLGFSDAAGQVELLTDFVGTQLLTLELSVPVSRVGTDELATFSLFSHVPATMSVEVPAGRQLIVNGATIEQMKEAPANRTLSMPVGGEREIQLQWTDAVGESLTDSLVFAQSVYAIGIQRDSLDWSALTQIDLYGKRFQELVFSVPRSLEITTVKAPGLQAWELMDDPDNDSETRITLSFREVLPSRVRVEMQGVQLTREEQTWTIADLQLKGSTTHTGGLALSASAQIRLNPVSMEGIRPATRRWKPVATYVPQGPLQFYDIWKSDFLFQLTADETNREVQAAVSQRLEFAETETRFSSMITLQALFSPLFELQTEIPVGWSVKSIQFGDEQLDWQFLQNNDASSVIRIPLPSPLKPGQTRSLSMELIREDRTVLEQDQQQELTLPDLPLQDVNVLEGTYSIAANERLDVIPQDMTGMDPVDLGTPAERFGYRYQNAHISGRILVQRKPTRFNVSTTTLIQADENTLTLSYRADLEIRGGGLRELELILPTEIPGIAEVQSLGSAQISRQQQQTHQQQTIWKLSFDQYLTGNVPLFLEIVFPREQLTDQTLPQLLFPQPELEELFLVFLAKEDQYFQVEVRDQLGNMISPIDPAELPMNPVQGRKRVVAGFHLIESGSTARLSIEKLDSSPIPTAIGQSLQIQTVTTEANFIQQQAALTFLAIGIQHLHIQLPEGAHLWSAMIDGMPVSTRKDTGGYRLPIPANVQDMNEHRLSLLYEMPHVQAGHVWQTSRSLAAPQIAVLSGLGEVQPLQILQTEWQVHHDAQMLLIPVSEELEVVEQHQQKSWLGLLKEEITSIRWQGALENLLVGFLLLIIPLGLAKLVSLGLLKVWQGTSATAVVVFLASIFLIGLCVIPMLLPSVQRARNAASRDMEETTVGSFGGGEDDSIREFSDQYGEMYEDESLTKQQFESSPRDMKRLPELTEHRALQKQEEISRQLALPDAPQSQVAEPQAEATPLPTELATTITRPTAEPQDVDKVKILQENAIQNNSESNMDFDGNGEQLQKEKLAALTGTQPAAEGLLSLPVEMQFPDHLQTTTFKSFEFPDRFQIRMISSQWILRIGILIAVLVVLFMWLLRDASQQLRWGVGLGLLSLPLILAGVLPEISFPLLEGFMTGVLMGAGILVFRWLCIWSLKCCQNTCHWCWGLQKKWIGIGLLLLLLPITNLQAQDAKLVVEEPPPASVEAAKIPLVFPYDEGESPLAAERVFVPTEHYLQLWQQAHPESSQEPAPMEYQLSEASYFAKILENPATAEQKRSQHTVELTARYVIRSYRSGQQLITLPVEPLMLQSLQVDGESVAVSVMEDQNPSVLVEGPGVHLIDAIFRFPATAIGVAGQFSLKLSPVASGQMTFELPGEDLQLRINEGKIPYRMQERQGQLYADFAIATGGTLTFSWQPSVSSTQLQFLSCDSSRQVLVRETGVELAYAFRFEIAQGSFSELEFQLPDQVSLKTLTGKDLAGYQLLENGRLRVLLKRAVEDQTVLSMSLFVPLSVSEERQQLICPDVIPLGVTREIGTWAIGWESLLDIRVLQTAGVRQLDHGQFQSLDQGALIQNIQRVFRFSSRPQQVSLEIRREPKQVYATQYSLIDLQPHKIHLAGIIDFEWAGEPQLAIDLLIPSDMQPIEVNGQQIRDWFISRQTETGDGVLTILFDSPQAGKTRVAVRGFIQRELVEQESLELQGIRALGTTRSRHYLAIGAAEMYGIVVEQSGGAQAIDPQKLPKIFQSVAKFPIRIGFVDNRLKPEALRLKLVREQAQVKADSVTQIAVSESSIDYGLSLQWIVSKAATDQFSFIGPNWLKDRIEFQAANLRQVLTDPVDEHRTRWTLQARAAIADKFFATAIISVPYPQNHIVSTPSLTFVSVPMSAGPDQQAVPLSIQSHYVMLVNLGRQTLEPISDHEDLLVTRSELPINVPNELAQQAIEQVRVTRQVVPSWELKPLEEQESPAATIFLAELTTVLERQGTYRTVAVYTIKNRRQQFLPVTLPETAELLSVLVNGQPARVVTRQLDQQAVTMVPLPPTGAADLAFDVRLVTRGDLGTGLGSVWWGKEVSLQRPDVLSPEQSSEFGIPVMHTVWKVSTPDDYLVHGVTTDDSNMRESVATAIQELRFRNRLQELSELSEIVRSSKNSYLQRQRAAMNLKSLKSSLESYSEELPVDESLEIQQLDILSDAEVSLGVVEQEISEEKLRGEQIQSRGRAYIKGINDDIYIGNSAVPMPQAPGSSPELQVDRFGRSSRFDLEGVTADDQVPSMNKKLQEKGKRQQTQEFRRSLIEENMKQNSRFLNDQQERMDLNQNGIIDSPVDGLRIQSYEFDNGQTQVSSGKEILARPGIAGRQSMSQEAEPFGLIQDSLGQQRGVNVRNEFHLFGEPSLNSEGQQSFRKPTLSDQPVTSFAFGRIAQGLQRESGQQSANSAKWTAIGGLSIPIDPPLHDQMTTFSKVGGNPRLTIRVQSRQVFEQVAGWGWTLVTAILLLCWLFKLGRAVDSQAWLRNIGGGFLIIGLLGFVLLSGPLAWVSLLIGGCGGMLWVAIPQQLSPPTK